MSIKATHTHIDLNVFFENIITFTKGLVDNFLFYKAAYCYRIFVKRFRFSFNSKKCG